MKTEKDCKKGIASPFFIFYFKIYIYHEVVACKHTQYSFANVYLNCIIHKNFQDKSRISKFYQLEAAVVEKKTDKDKMFKRYYALLI